MPRLSPVWKVIILVVVLAGAAAGMLLFGACDPSREPRSEPAGYRPSGTTTWLGETFAAPLAPRLDLPSPPVLPLTAGAVRRLTVPASSRQFRIARFRHASGGAARIRYDCGTPPRGADAKTCREQVLCIGPPATPPPPGCEAMVREGRLMILASDGMLTLEAIAGDAAVEQR